MTQRTILTLVQAVLALGLPVAAGAQTLAPMAVLPATAPAADEIAWPVANRSFERGQIFTEQDFTMQRVPARSTAGFVPLEAIVGKAAARPIKENSVLRPADVMEPQLVYRGNPVTINVRTGGIVITSSGRSLTDGQLGKPVRVFSNVSGRTLDAYVEGPAVVHLAGF